MPNTNVFRGSDATLVLAVEDDGTEEGVLADKVISDYDLSSIVGHLQKVSVTVQNDLRPYHAIGKRFPAEIRPGNIDVSGYAQRAYINGALIKLLLGKGAQTAKSPDPLAQPSFNLVLKLANPARPDASATLVLFGVKFDTWNFTLPEDDFVMEAVTFKALRIGSEESA